MDYTKHSYDNPLYNTWKDMRKRCQNPSRVDYKYYGGKGIKVCARWESFENFIVDMLPTYFVGGTIDRVRNAGDYEKDNCLWSTKTKQQANRSHVKGYWKNYEEVAALYAAGHSQDSIARRLGMSQASVSRTLAKSCKQLGES